MIYKVDPDEDYNVAGQSRYGDIELELETLWSLPARHEEGQEIDNYCFKLIWYKTCNRSIMF
jgi:hypothetical protein